MKAIIFAILALAAVAVCDKAPMFVVDDMIETLRGIFESWDIEHEEVNELLTCVKTMKNVEAHLAEAIKEIKQIDIRNLSKLVEVITKLFVALQNAFKEMHPCIEVDGDVRKLLDKFIHLGFFQILKKITLNLLDNGRLVLNYLVSAVHMVHAGDYFRFGFDIGEVIELLFFRTPDP